jgi:hypothetical protein
VYDIFFDIRIIINASPFYILFVCCVKRARPFGSGALHRLFCLCAQLPKAGAYFFRPPLRAKFMISFSFSPVSLGGEGARGAFNAPHNSDLCVSYERIFCHLFIHLRRLVIRAEGVRASFDFCTRAESLVCCFLESWGSHSIATICTPRQQFAVRNNELWKLGRHTRVCFSTREFEFV